MNPNIGSANHGLNIVTRDSSNNIIMYTNNAATFLTAAGPTNIALTKLKSSSLSLTTKSNYEICADLI